MALAVPEGWRVEPGVALVRAAGDGALADADVRRHRARGRGARRVRRGRDRDVRGGRGARHRHGARARRHDRVQPGTSAEEPWLSEDGRLAARRRGVRRPRALHRQRALLRLQVRAARRRDGRDAQRGDRQRVPRRGVHGRVELGRRCCARTGRSGPVELRVARPRPQRAARGRPDGVPAVLRLVHPPTAGARGSGGRSWCCSGSQARTAARR